MRTIRIATVSFGLTAAAIALAAGTLANSGSDQVKAGRIVFSTPA
ncbi:hypothetical protein [Sphingomonas sp.]|jgi:hypothetical protein|nr:hypothetical protein [Sphingomonas sp.]HEU0045936.1 hypothetical protein [Sphingomonas sp.]